MLIRLHSSLESMRNGDITFLSIMETVLAISISIFIAVKYETLIHIAISVCIAPLLLLRTEKSTELGLNWFASIIDEGDLHYAAEIHYDIVESTKLLKTFLRSSSFSTLRFISGVRFILEAFLTIFLESVYVSTLSLVIKIAAATYTFLRHPIYTIGAIPTNWKRIALCTDMVYPPELLPGIEELSERPSVEDEEENFTREVISIYSFRRIAAYLRVEHHIPVYKRSFILLSKFVVLSPILIASILFSFAYRWSLKSTSFIYAPLTWILNSTFSVRKKLRYYLKFSAKSALGRFVFFYSFLVVLISLGKLYLFVWGQSLLFTLTNTPGWKVLAIYIAPRQLENVGVVVDLWHVTAFISSLLAIFMYFYADLILLRIKDNQQWSEDTAIAITGSNILLRGILSMYTITCVLYVTIIAIPPETWQQYSFQFLPW